MLDDRVPPRPEPSDALAIVEKAHALWAKSVENYECNAPQNWLEKGHAVAARDALALVAAELRARVPPRGGEEPLELSLKPPAGSAERDALTKVVIPMSEYRQLSARIAELEAVLRKLLADCAPLAWTKRPGEPANLPPYWSFVPTDAVSCARRVLEGARGAGQ